MPYSICPALESFLQQLDQCLEGLKGVYKIADDFLINGQGDTDEKHVLDHDQNQKNLLEHCKARIIKLNKKFQFKSSEVSFIGHVITKNGLKADPKKVEAVIKMEQTSKCNSSAEIHWASEVLVQVSTRPIRTVRAITPLTHNSTEGTWTHDQEDTLERIKHAFFKAPVLKYFSKSDPTEGQGDASKVGLGFVLMELGQPVTFTSRALRPAELKYSQI